MESILVLMAGVFSFLLFISGAHSTDKRPPLKGRGKRGGVMLRTLLQCFARGSRASAALCTSVGDYLLLAIFRGNVALTHALYKSGAPAWLVNSAYSLIPSAIRRAGARIYLDKRVE